jgi:hypothetical protein
MDICGNSRHCKLVWFGNLWTGKKKFYWGHRGGWTGVENSRELLGFFCWEEWAPRTGLGSCTLAIVGYAKGLSIGDNSLWTP